MAPLQPPPSSTPFITLTCNFQLEDAKGVALVWDGQEHPIECTSGKYEASFKVYFDNEEPKTVHFRVDNETSNDHRLCHPRHFSDITCNMSVKRTGDMLSISAEENQGAKPLRLVPITPEVSRALPNMSELFPKEKQEPLTKERQELIAESAKALKAARATLPRPPPI